MPPRSKKPCAAPLCPNLTTTKFCEEHADRERKAVAERNAAYDREHRDPRITEFYKSTAWRKARLQALVRDNYLCQRCLKQKKIVRAVIVHHLIEITTEKGWALRLHIHGLESVCHACHNKIHNAGK